MLHLEEYAQHFAARNQQDIPLTSLMGKALTYLDNQWPHLTAYLDHDAAVDNNETKRAIRPFLIGRKNWLFANSVKGAKTSSALYSIVETVGNN